MISFMNSNFGCKLLIGFSTATLLLGTIACSNEQDTSASDSGSLQNQASDEFCELLDSYLQLTMKEIGDSSKENMERHYVEYKKTVERLAETAPTQRIKENYEFQLKYSKILKDKKSPTEAQRNENLERHNQNQNLVGVACGIFPESGGETIYHSPVTPIE